MLLTAIEKEDEDFKDYVFTKAELERKAGVSYKTDELRETAKNLMQKVLEIKTPKGFTLFTWFSYFNYEDGVITCSFDKRLKPYLLELKQYILADARHLMHMQSTYSKRIYMLLKEHAKFGSRTFDVEELMYMLKVPKSYKYADFKRRVLLEAKADIDKYTDLKVDFTEEKLGRKVAKVHFEIRKNDEDLNTFIKIIRENYVNQALYFDKDNNTIKCSEDGKLYCAETQKTYDSKTAETLWHMMHEKRQYLLIFQDSLF
jgi:plasmid replication initiation protein